MRRVTVIAVALGVGIGVTAGTGAAGAGEGPLFGAQWARGHTLPLPWGVGLTVYEQRQGYDIDRLAVGVPGFEGLPTERLDIANRLREVNVQLDAWLLPFLNVMLLGGQIDGRTVVDFSDLVLPIPLDRITINYDGEVYGGGVTLAAGTERLFGSLNAVWTRTSLSGDFDSEADAFVVAPRVGLHDDRGALWLGAMYQRADEHHSGTVALPFIGPVPFEVELSQESEWNGLIGAHAALDAHWNVELEGGFGDRKSASATVTYRF